MNGKNIIDEIQFLRSISIIFVILFHFELLNFNGGFIGVDIFFTISGFLITSIILKEKNSHLQTSILKEQNGYCHLFIY